MNIQNTAALIKQKLHGVAENMSAPGVQKGLFTCLVGAAAILSTPEVAAWSTPAAGSFAYDMYDIGVNKLLKGPVGFVAGVGIIAYSASNFSQGPWKAIMGILMGSGVAKADTITSSMGAMVDGAEHLSHIVELIK
ncbi:conjugative transfer protein TraE [Aeromonas caviae]|uniref:Conjugative transfer protein TraE n=1 Tax=Aeromonas caviae TaxID=648 RepID=A0ABD0B964_AERCA|nr:MULTISPECIES: hypothetical protein [Aeromonas]BCK65883.1 conjugative transfer protein TraE [Aeromonas hydrophila]BCR31474.1 conjugative transfer protein TraE [Aeromonas caviae]GJA71858.1 conjugative transfer protein TraE [Aeromonas caviae]GJA81669.1 conjugative transfer protein TraE [Aeromonas caviae]GJB00697.1 conjugative transfer protein TraE [Aeromonas caviae]